MFINDNLSVALALPERVGLHIGQTDIPIKEARRLLGPNRLLGHSVHNVEQAQEALQLGIADYVGVGPVYGTKSKAGIGEEDILTVRGARQVIEHLSKDGKRLPSVLIGGINEKTAARALYGTTSIHENGPDGIAVISAIVSSRTPEVAAENLWNIVNQYRLSRNQNEEVKQKTLTQDEQLGDIEHISRMLQDHRKGAASGPPLIQTLTSHVSSTLSANIALAFSASPIMSHQEAEADDLGKVTGAVVLNIGTIGEEARRGMKAVGNAANRLGKVSPLHPFS
jgi:thiamine-phosphate diphosphorylase/hydroxyethylthiazole kinase